MKELGYFEKIRNMVPARTMALYTTLTGTYSVWWEKSTDIPVWVPFVVIGLCLAAQIAMAISDGVGWRMIWEIIAFILYGLIQPFYGILGVFEVPGVVNIVLGLVVAAYVFTIPKIKGAIKPRPTAR